MGILLSAYRFIFDSTSLEDVLEKKFKEVRSIHMSLRTARRLKLIATIVAIVCGLISIYMAFRYGNKSLHGQVEYNMKNAGLSLGITLLILACQVTVSKLCAWRLRVQCQKLQEKNEELSMLMKRAVNELSFKKVSVMIQKYQHYLPDPYGFNDTSKNRFGGRLGAKKQPNQRDSYVDVIKKASAANGMRNKSDASWSDRTSSRKMTNKQQLTKPGPPFPTFANRSITDKIVDKLIGDDPNNRVALICSTCKIHNGLVPPDAKLPFEYECFKCNSPNIYRLHKGDKDSSSKKTNTSSTTRGGDTQDASEVLSSSVEHASPRSQLHGANKVDKSSHQPSRNLKTSKKRSADMSKSSKRSLTQRNTVKKTDHYSDESMHSDGSMHSGGSIHSDEWTDLDESIHSDDQHHTQEKDQEA